MRNAKNIKQHELISCKAKVINAKDKKIIGINGTIVDETKNLIVIKTSKGIKKILKENAVFEIMIPETKEKVIIEGDEISLQPEKRLKKRKKAKRRW